MTPWKMNMEPQNGGLEDYFLFEIDDFEVPRQFSGVQNSGLLAIKQPMWEVVNWSHATPDIHAQVNFLVPHLIPISCQKMHIQIAKAETVGS